MTTIEFQKVLDRVCGLIGTPQTSLGADDLATIFSFINEETEDLWKFWWWPELMRSEVRYYRDAYDNATAYVAGDEIYYSTSATYYTCILASTGNLPTDATYWTALTQLDAYIALNQAGQTQIGTVRLVAWYNPLTTKSPGRLPFILGPNGISLPGCTLPASAYVWFRLPSVDYSGAAYDAEGTYTTGQVRYYASAEDTAGFLGDYWTVVSATSAGENPETTPAKWTRLDYPEIFREPAARAAHYRFLVKDGATEAQIGIARGAATDAKLDLMGRYVGQQSQGGPFR